ncbi:TPA: methionine--tRNA ligase subunit beta [Candidatus Micrarchaeota archaeon]|nr:MAG: methionine--tRNA ligase subunit beta [Candidatus Micrarchaeota archaeon CG1_02_51_15]HII38698.1 methionine--tRNA ligase subunit beta [Candidatus Micrarchaeota archaeon]
MTETVAYEDFAKLDLRVARIVSAERVEGSNKLYKLSVDLGGEQRTLAAGIAEYYSAEELVGKQIIVVANLQPRRVRGVDSQGMLLAAGSEDGSVVAVLSPEKEVPEGTKIT